MSKPPFKSALLLAARESLATVDKQALRACGIRDFQILSSGVEAARLLAEARVGTPEVVLCNEKLADMTGDEFVRLIRLHPALVPYPVIVAVTAMNAEIRARARECGYSGLLVRPYPHDALQNQLDLALRCRDATAEALKARTNTDTTAFETALAKFAAANNPEEQLTDQVYRQGLLAVRQQRWEEAISLLQDVLRRDGSHVEAMVALGTCWQGKGNTERFSALMSDSIAVFADRKQWEKALAVSQRLIRTLPDTPNPLLAEAGRLIASGSLDDLPDALDAALRLPVSTSAVDGLVRACAANPDPAEAHKALVTQLFKAGSKKTALLFRERLEFAAANPSISATSATSAANSSVAATPTGVAPASEEVYALPIEKPLSPKAKKKSGPRELVEPTSAFAESFPKLHEALMVAKVTLSLFRQLK